MYINHFFKYSACPQLIVAPFDNLVVSGNLEACRLFNRDNSALEKTAISDLFGANLPRFIQFTRELIANGSGWSDRLVAGDGTESFRVEISGNYSVVGEQTLLHLTLNRADELEQRRRHSAGAHPAAGTAVEAENQRILQVMSQLIMADWPRDLGALDALLHEQAEREAEPAPSSEQAAFQPAAPLNPGYSIRMEEKVLTSSQLKERERRNLIQALKRSEGRIFGPGGAAELVDMKPTTLSAKLKRYQIDRRLFKPREGAVANTGSA